MHHASYASNGSVYNVVPIEDYTYIGADTYRVMPLITDTDLIIYTGNMAKSVDQGLAYSIYKDGIRKGFVYNRISNNKYVGSSIFIDDVVCMLIGMKTMFDITDMHKISFIPHESNLKYFKSLLSGTSIREYYTNGSPLVVLRSHIESKGIRLFNYFGIV